MQEVLPGIWDWQAFHEGIGMPVHSHAVDGTVIDPMVPEGGMDALPIRPERVLLTNRHHDRHALRFVEAFDIPVLCHRAGLHEFERRPLSPEGFNHGDEVAPGVRAVGVLEGWPDESALVVEDRRVVVIADSLIRDEQERLAFVADRYLGDDADQEKANLRAGLRRLLALDFDHLLLAHGPPWIGGAKAGLREFVQE